MGSGIVVPGSEVHPDVLAPFFRPEGECWAYATMHVVEEEDGFADRNRIVVEVRLDDEPVGRLSPRLSAEFLPAIHYLADMRAETAARVTVRGDRTASEVILYAARSHDLPATWPDGLTRSPVASPAWHYWVGKGSELSQGGRAVLTNQVVAGNAGLPRAEGFSNRRTSRRAAEHFGGPSSSPLWVQQRPEVGDDQTLRSCTLGQ